MIFHTKVTGQNLWLTIYSSFRLCITTSAYYTDLQYLRISSQVQQRLFLRDTSVGFSVSNGLRYLKVWNLKQSVGAKLGC